MRYLNKKIKELDSDIELYSKKITLGISIIAAIVALLVFILVSKSGSIDIPNSELNKMKNASEENLPRNQNCVLTFVKEAK